MVDYQNREWRKRERSSTFSDQSKLLNHCRKMFRSISTRPLNRINNEISTSTNESINLSHRRLSIPICRSHEYIRKAFSLILNKVDFSICNPSDDTEMHEFIRHTSSEENLNTIRRSPSNISDTTIISQPTLTRQNTCTSTVHRTFSQLKNKFRHRNPSTSSNNEKNTGFLVVDTPDTDPVLILDDNIDHHQTQHSKPCLQINDISFDLNQIQYTSTTPMTANISPAPGTSLTPYVPNYDICANNELEIQSTRSSIECGIPQSDLLSVYDTQASQMLSTTSSTSTNSSAHEYTEIDRTVLDDNEYIQAQLLDLDRIINYEVGLSNELHELEVLLETELNFNAVYDETLQENLRLKDELEKMQEEYDRYFSVWACDLCTFLNQPYSVTKRDICEICEGPSPLKRATLIK